MKDVNFTFRTPEDLKADFVRLAKENNRTAAILLRDFMREYVQKSQERNEKKDLTNGH